MGVDIQTVCFFIEPTLFDLASNVAATCLLGMLLMAGAARVPVFRSVFDELQLLAASAAIPVTVGLLAGVLNELPGYAAVGLGAAAAAMPVGMLAIADLGDAWRPDAALDLGNPRKPRLGQGTAKQHPGHFAGKLLSQ